MNGFWLRPLEVAAFHGRYTVLGQPGGKPIILLPSPLTCGEIYRATAEELARNYRVFVVEMPGGGRSPRLAKPWTMANYAGWVAAFIDDFGLRGATVIGHSYAGGPALLLPAFHPDRAGRIVVVDGVGAGGPHSLGKVIAGRLIDTAEVEFKLAFRGWHYVVSTVLGHFRNFFEQSREARYANLLPQAAAVSVPVLLAWGAKDHTIPPRCARLLHEALPRSRVQLFDPGSHCWLITHAPEFAEIVSDWISNGVSDVRKPDLAQPFAATRAATALPGGLTSASLG